MDFKRKINNVFSTSLVPFFLSRSEQEKILNLYNNPKDLIERSYFQFKVQFQTFSFYKRCLNNIFGFLATFYFIFVSIFQKSKNDKYIKSKTKKFAIFPYKNYHYPDVIPVELLNEFEIYKIDFMSSFKFGIKELALVFKIWLRYPTQFYFLSKCTSKILFYNFMIKNYTPDCLIVSSEYSFTSSIATLYCRNNKIEHVNITHGEHFYVISKSFFEFDRFYVWDNFYTDLFIKMKASPTQFLVGQYLNLKMDIKPNQEKYNFTYYLGRESDHQLNKIKDTLIKIDSKENICIRFHPRYSSEEKIRNIFEGFDIENPLEISLAMSFSLTHNVMSLFSACMVQAFFNGKNVVIDDLSHPIERLEVLRESEYLIFSKPHKLISQILKSKIKENVT